MSSKDFKYSNSNLYKPPFEKCYLSSDNTNIKIIHLILTRFIIPFYKPYNFTEKIYNTDYFFNGIRVMKKYLLPSLQIQTCKDFIWILIIGNKVNITKVKSFIKHDLSFKTIILFEKNFKGFLKKITKGYDVLITTRIDYDDRIYYDAVNDVRKYVNINRPISLYGYNRGIIYFEFNNKYYNFYKNYRNKGTMSIFVSLIIVLNKVNDTYCVYDLGHHNVIRKTLLNRSKSFGVKRLNYEPANFDYGDTKFVWVRHNYSGQFQITLNALKHLKSFNFNLNNFYGQNR